MMIGLSEKSSSSGKVVLIFVTGTIVHLLYLHSVFDIYFTSPLVHNVPAIVREEREEPAARRLILFLVDGMRADRLVEGLDSSSRYHVPYLREILEERGSWGISHTRVPTETRPGHVAIISGFYEDVASITKGWKENPVEFDSVFNQSRFTWAWGASDTVGMFTKTTGLGDRMYAEMYSMDFVDFASKNASVLDKWVFEHAYSFLENVKNGSELMDKLHQDQIIFFFHLLGTDVLGHGAKPHSVEYKQNVQYIDEVVKRLESKIEAFYGHDGKTVYVLTSDHGMTDWGSHGSGLNSETETPLIAWGAGIMKPDHMQEKEKFYDAVTKKWSSFPVRRKDVEQADLCALISALIGLPFPVNSVGKLPIAYLNLSEEEKAGLLLRNSKQIMAQFIVKEKAVKAKSLWFRPYELTENDCKGIIYDIEEDIGRRRFSLAMDKSNSLIKNSLQGLHYYHRYDRLYLSLVMTFGFLGWILNVLLELLKESFVDIDLCNGYRCRSKRLLICGASVAVITTITLLYLTSASGMHYLYCLIPIPLWYQVLRSFGPVIRRMKRSYDLKIVIKGVFRTSLTLLIIELLTLAFFYRYILSLLLIVGGILSSVVVYRRSGHCFHFLNIVWMVALLLLSIFPLLPVISGNENYALVAIAGLFTSATGMSHTFLLPPKDRSGAVILVLTVFVMLCTALRLHTAQSVHMDRGLPKVNQILSWSLLILLPCAPFFSKPYMTDRILAIFLSLFSIYVLTSINYEGLFFICLTLVLTLWILMEKYFIDIKYAESMAGNLQEKDSGEKAILSAELDVFDYFRIATEVIFFIVIGFFGTGNISSINSFDPASVYCFITIFDPFIMGFILMLKVAIPFLVVSCFFNAMRTTINIDVRRIFLAVLVCTDFMALHFFFLIKDEGSWLDIGASLSKFVIVLGFILFFFPLFELGSLFFWNVQRDDTKSHQH